MIDDVTRERLAGLASFLPAFESADTDIGFWNGLETTRRGFTLPSFSPSPIAQAFVRRTQDLGWVRPDFDWRAWLASDEAHRLLEDPTSLAAASPPQLSCLLTVMVRQERFLEGSLETCHERGVLAGVLRRAASLANDQADGPECRPLQPTH